MAYIESFFLYVAAVLFMFAVLFGGAVVLYMLVGQMKLFYSIGGMTWEKEKNLLFKLIKNRFFKLAILAFFASFGFFYIFKAVDYFSDKRAYPQAKAYKIVADLVLFNYDLFIANRNLYYRPIGLKFIKPYQNIQSYLMQKGFQYIPKDDAERAIWRYEYFYANYVRARAAPIDFEKLTPDDLGYILRIGGHPTIYKPQAKQMLIEVEYLLDMLMDSPMKDKRYDQVERYMTTILFSEWLEKFSFLHYTLGVRTVKEDSSKKYRDMLMQWTDDPKYLKRLSKLSRWLDVTKEKIDNSKTLQQEMKRHKLLYPDLMGLRVYFRARLAYVDLLYKPFSCQLESLQKYYKTRREFINYAKCNDNFKKFDWRERVHFEKIVMFRRNDFIQYILYKFCHIEKQKLEYKDNIDNLNIENIVLSKNKKILKRIQNGR